MILVFHWLELKVSVRKNFLAEVSLAIGSAHAAWCVLQTWLMCRQQEGEAKLIFVSAISYPVPSEKPSYSKVSPGVNLLIAWFSSTPLIHCSNLLQISTKRKKKKCFPISNRNP